MSMEIRMTGRCTFIRFVFLLLAMPALPARAAELPWDDSGQLILVVAADWNASKATLRTYARVADGWQPAAEAMPVVIGRSGSAWGIGLHPVQSGVQKKEGDGRSPAGVFGLGSAFGYASVYATALPYAAMDADDWCIDDPDSPYYNRLVDASDVGAAAVARSTEPMRRDLHADGDQRYQLGFVIEHNAMAMKHAGSCIFAHLWKSADSATAGCTAMAAADMRRLLEWLDPAQKPLFVLLPVNEYRRLRAEWQLPDAGADLCVDSRSKRGTESCR
jgi:L,D-peptidoglycan transpeptidase YkuD (ErfK/YbiS/YcfS/YnhG family)